MNVSPNNNLVSFATRRWLGQCAREEQHLTRAMANLVERVVDQCRPVQPGGMIYDVAFELGSGEERALAAGSLAELFYALCSFTDDLQDGDARRYLGDVPAAIQLNTCAHLQCLVAVRAADVVLSPGDLGPLLLEMYAAGARMLHGQYFELQREHWDLAGYERVARMSAGGLFAFLFQIAAFAAGAERAGWRKLGDAFGSLLQMLADVQQGDVRLTQLPKAEIAALGRRFSGELRSAASALGPAGGRIAQAASQLSPWSA